MIMEKIILVPVGGLANRMRAVASAVTLTYRVWRKLEVLWFRDWGLNAPFFKVFEEPELMNISFSETSCKHLLMYDRPRRRNFYLPKLFQKLLFEDCLYERDVRALCYKESELEEWASQSGRLYIATCDQFVNYSTNLLRSLFHPVASVCEEVERRFCHFSKHTVGVHIRRADHTVAIRQSPLDLFFTQLDKESDMYDDLCIYLATDSEEVKQQLRNRYGSRVHTAETVSDRGSISGIKDAVADMYTLSRTQKIYGSSGSSFSELAAQLGDIPLQILRV